MTRSVEITPPPTNGCHRLGASAPDVPCVDGPVTRHTAAHLAEVTEADLDACAAALRAAVIRGSHIYPFGNGGSATTSSHFACDLSHRRPDPGGRWARVHCLYDMAMHCSAATVARRSPCLTWCCGCPAITSASSSQCIWPSSTSLPHACTKHSAVASDPAMITNLTVAGDPARRAGQGQPCTF